MFWVIYTALRNHNRIVYSTNSNWPITLQYGKVGFINNNSLLGDVVSDGFNMVYRNKDSILDQIYENQIFLAFIVSMHFRIMLWKLKIIVI